MYGSGLYVLPEEDEHLRSVQRDICTFWSPLPQLQDSHLLMIRHVFSIFFFLSSSMHRHEHCHGNRFIGNHPFLSLVTSIADVLLSAVRGLQSDVRALPRIAQWLQREVSVLVGPSNQEFVKDYILALLER